MAESDIPQLVDAAREYSLYDDKRIEYDYAMILSNQIWRQEMKKKLFIFVLTAIMLGMVSGCATGPLQVNTPVPAGTPGPNGQINVPAVSIPIYWPGPNPLVNKPDTQGGVAGILLGIWHGVISPITLIVSFLNPNVQMYEVHNDGSPYNLGFLLGVALVFIILGAMAGSKRR